MKTKVVILMLGVLLCAGGQVRAEWITIAVSGTVSDVDDWGGLDGKIHIGDAITGTYTYDSAALGISNSNTLTTDYWYHSTPAGVSLNIGGFDFSTDPTNVNFRIFVGDNIQIPEEMYDSYGFASGYNLPLSNGAAVNGLYWYLGDWTHTALTSEVLPLTAPDLSKWGGPLEIAGAYRSVQDFHISGQIASATVVPEPITIFLFGFGMILARKKLSN